jgi:hypothetical protein
MEPEKLIELIEATAYEPRSYSGRGMSGSECVGVSGDTFGILGSIIQANAENHNPAAWEDIANLIESTRTEALGHNMIVYWPDIAWPDEESEGEDES